MRGKPHFHYPLPSDTAHVERVRDALRACVDVLRQPAPDTFLGRQTFAPFPKEQAATAQDGIEK